MIHITPSGRYSLQRGYNRGTEEHYYNVKMNRWIDGEFRYVRERLYVAKAVIDNFIINYDKIHNTRIWHMDRDVANNSASNSARLK